MKAGDYVRTKYGSIRKIINLETYCNLIIETDKGDLIKDNITKTSPNIIELIEVGDYINGDKVVNFMLNNNLRAGVIVDSSHYGYDFDEIKSIVTKEQFKSMEYKIGE